MSSPTTTRGLHGWKRRPGEKRRPDDVLNAGQFPHVRLPPVEVFAVDAPRRHARQPQLALEAAHHRPRTAHEDRQLAWVATGDGENTLGAEATIAGGVDQMRVQRFVAVGDLADLSGKRRLAGGGVEEVDALRQLT